MFVSIIGDDAERYGLYRARRGLEIVNSRVTPFYQLNKNMDKDKHILTPYQEQKIKLMEDVEARDSDNFQEYFDELQEVEQAEQELEV